MNFLDLYKTITKIDESDMNQGTGIMAPPSTPEVSECGMEMGGCDMPHSSKQQDSVSMSVNMNGQGAGGIRDLMNILRNIETNIPDSDGDEEDGAVLIGDPEEELDMEPVAFEEPAEISVPDEPLNSEEYENEPNTQEFDNIISGNDLNKEKAAYPMAQKGDNAMAAVKKAAIVSSISESLMQRLHSHYNEVKER